jgi:hypothetical protein
MKYARRRVVRIVVVTSVLLLAMTLMIFYALSHNDPAAAERAAPASAPTRAVPVGPARSA